MNRQVRLVSRPSGMPDERNFEIVETSLPEPAPGEVLARNLLVSVDPYLRGRMDAGRSYLPPIELGAVMSAHTVARVTSSTDPAFQPGDLVTGMGGWEDYGSYPAGALRKIDLSVAPAEAFLGVLGMPGSTAHLGMVEIGRPAPGETVLVSAASGPVGSLAGQLAALRGARVVGVAGGAEKCRYVVEELGFDACVDHRDPDFAESLAKACPDGIDVNFENVGGDVLAAAWPLLNDFARVAVCGLVAEYNDIEPRPGPSLRNLLTRRILLQGFIISDHQDRFADFYREVSGLVRDGLIKHREHIVDGLENAPAALLGLLTGSNFGKLVIRVAG